MFYYSTANLVTATTLDSVSSEDTVYVKEWLYNGRPSKPFRFTGNAAEWVKVDLAGPTLITLVAAFNHNFTNAANIRLQASAADSWAPAGMDLPLVWREHDLRGLLSKTLRWWMFWVNDAGNPDPLQIGELWLGTWSQFANARLQPGRRDPTKYVVDEKTTAYGQAWTAYLSENDRLSLRFLNLQDPATIDDIRAFLSSIGGPAGRFVVIPDHRQPHVFMVKVAGDPDATRLIYGDKELREWSLELEVLTRGITLL